MMSGNYRTLILGPLFSGARIFGFEACYCDEPVAMADHSVMRLSKMSLFTILSDHFKVIPKWCILWRTQTSLKA